MKRPEQARDGGRVEYQEDRAHYRLFIYDGPHAEHFHSDHPTHKAAMDALRAHVEAMDHIRRGVMGGMS
jgi:hypothetical protein